MSGVVFVVKNLLDRIIGRLYWLAMLFVGVSLALQ